MKQTNHNVPKKSFECSLRDVLKTSSKGRSLEVDSGCLWDAKLGRLQDVRSRHLRDVRSGCPWNGQIESLRDLLGTLEEDNHGTSWGPISANWVCSQLKTVCGGMHF